MPRYYVEMPFRAIQYFSVEAKSAAEAKRLAKEGAGENVEVTDWRVTHCYAPNHAELEDRPMAISTSLCDLRTKLGDD